MMNVYDFDKTIYRDDSSMDFYLFNLKRQPSLALFWPSQALAFLRYGLKQITKTEMKSIFYRYFRAIEDIQARVDSFWTHHQAKLMPYYLAQKQTHDVIISASPEFLLKPICHQLGVTLIASIVDPKTGHSEENCYGQEKVRRFRALHPNAVVEAFYSDSRSDTPMAQEAQRAYLVSGDRIEAW